MRIMGDIKIGSGACKSDVIKIDSSEVASKCV
jgi:hypothetical protein